MTIKCNANLFRIATLCQSGEKARFYLQGVYIEPHTVRGVTMTATDGRKLVSLYDETGFADERAIIKLTPAALRECKTQPRANDRLLVVNGANAGVHDTDQEGEARNAVAVSSNCRIDGEFPAYRRVIPVLSDKRAPVCIRSIDGSIFVEIAKSFGSTFCIVADDPSAPALVLFPDRRAFGVIMPVRDETGSTLPDWFNARPAQAAVA